MQRYFATNKKENNLILLPSDLHHIFKVMRMQQDDKIEVVYQNVLYLATISNNDIVIEKILEESHELDVEITIVQSLVTETKWDLIIQKLTELGVKRIIPFKACRSVCKIDDKKIVSKLQRWGMICKEAAEQSKRTVIPEVSKPVSLKELVTYNADLKVICSVNSTNLIQNVFTNNKKYDKIIVVIGPEGGFTKEEEDFLIENGFQSMSLGSRVLRTETASIYIASIINYVFMR